MRYPVLAADVSGPTPSSKTNLITFDMSKIADLPVSWNVAQVISNLKSKFGAYASSLTYSLAYTIDPDGVYAFQLNYQYSQDNPTIVSDTGLIENITGGPPASVYYGATFPVYVTFEVWACSNSYIYAEAATLSAPSSAAATPPPAAQQYFPTNDANTNNNTKTSILNSAALVQASQGSHVDAWTDSYDMFLGNFVAPTKTDISGSINSDKTTWVLPLFTPGSTTYASQSTPAFPVGSKIRACWALSENDGGWGGIDAVNWNVGLLSPPSNNHAVNVTVTVSPKPGYELWFKPTTITKAITVAP